MIKNTDVIFGYKELQGSYGKLISPNYPNGKVVPNKVLSNEKEMGGIER